MTRTRIAASMVALTKQPKTSLLCIEYNFTRQELSSRADRIIHVHRFHSSTSSISKLLLRSPAVHSFCLPPHEENGFLKFRWWRVESRRSKTKPSGHDNVSSEGRSREARECCLHFLTGSDISGKVHSILIRARHGKDESFRIPVIQWNASIAHLERMES